jgi:hypothetical protein
VRNMRAVSIGLLLVVTSGSLWSELRFPEDVEIRQDENAARAEKYWLLASKDGKIWFVRDYWLEGETLHYVLRDGSQSSLPLAQIDLLLTRQLSRERGEQFRLLKPLPSRPADQVSPRKPTPAVASSQTPQAPARTSLQGIRKIYVEQIGRDLDRYLVAEITRQFKGKVIVVLQAEGADAILTGGARDYWGRMFWPTTVSLIDTNRRVVLWSWEVAERGQWWDMWRPDKVAERLVRNLRTALEAAEKGR